MTTAVAAPKVTYAPVMSRRERAVFVVLLAANIALTARYGWWWFLPGHVPRNLTSGPMWLIDLADFAPFIALTVLESLRVLLMLVAWVNAALMVNAREMPVPEGLRVAVLTAIVPASEPVSLLEGTFPAMMAIRSKYPFDVWILDEGDDSEVKAMCERFGVHHFSRHGIERYNQPSGPFQSRTKAGNHNAWHDQHGADYDVVAQFDLDHIAEPHFLEATLGYFADPDVGFVVMPQVYYRNAPTSWIARGADEGNFGFSAITQRGGNRLGTVILLGSNHVVRTTALESVGGYASHITEDHLTGLRLITTRNPVTGNKWKGVYTEKIVTIGEGPSRWSSWLSQQLRWAYGMMLILQDQFPRLMFKMRPQQVLGIILVDSYYPSIAGILFIAGPLCVFHLLFGLNALNAPFDDWLSYFLPQVSIAIAMYYWLQRFFLRETDKGWAVRHILTLVGAMVIYLEAVVMGLLRRRLTYVVTPKGEVGVREPVMLFRFHIAIFLVTLISLVYAFATGTGEWVIRFWAALMVVQMLSVVITGVAFPSLLRTSLSWGVIRFFNRYTVRVGVALVVTVFGLAVAPDLPVFREPPRQQLASIVVAPDRVVAAAPSRARAGPVLGDPAAPSSGLLRALVPMQDGGADVRPHDTPRGKPGAHHHHHSSGVQAKRTP